MKKLLTCILLVCCSFSVGDWVRVSVDSRTSVTFPSAPEKKDFQGNAMLFADIDTGSRVMIMPIDMLPFGLDSATVAQQYKSDEFKDQLKTGMLAKLPGCSLTGEKRLDTKGWPSFEFDLQKDKPDASFQFKQIYARTIFVGSVMYALYFYEKEGVNGAANREKFFGSFEVK